MVSYLIASTIAAPVYGRLGDAFGRRRLMFAALAFSSSPRSPARRAPTIELLTLARVLQGLGGGGLMTLSQALVGEAIPPRERARYQGYLAAVAVCANTFGPVAGGYLTQHFGWQSVFLINVPLGLLALWLMRKLENRIPDKPNWRPDPLGLLLFTIFVTTTLLASSRRSMSIWAPCRWPADWLAIGVIVAGLLCAPGDAGAPSPLIPLSLLRPADDLAQRRARRLPRRRPGVADHLPADLSRGGARALAVADRPAAGAADDRDRHRFAA